jgi:transposase-like protein
MRESVKEKKVQKRYDEEFKRQAVELVIHSGKTHLSRIRDKISSTVSNFVVHRNSKMLCQWFDMRKQSVERFGVAGLVVVAD